ncbi:hypothetical protein SRABI118_02328 [Massilia sp. Bi118]|nr:hypothetical protein SRABI118_02328 [Massilia sp. Bi118]
MRNGKTEKAFGNDQLITPVFRDLIQNPDRILPRQQECW